jgi:hypothetical protein
MTGIAIYVEGGGETRALQASLRQGFDGLLRRQKEAARIKRMSWKVVPEGGRDQAFQAFSNAVRQNPAVINVLLVDAEEPLHLGAVNPDPKAEASARVEHLRKRDKWDFKGTDPARVQLMVRAMEAWIVADVDALQKYYGQGFNPAQLPARQNLEDEPKASLYSALSNATRNARTKGEYAKRRHAAELLPLLDVTKVARRCPRFEVFTAWLDRVIQGAS